MCGELYLKTRNESASSPCDGVVLQIFYMWYLSSLFLGEEMSLCHGEIHCAVAQINSEIDHQS